MAKAVLWLGFAGALAFGTFGVSGCSFIVICVCCLIAGFIVALVRHGETNIKFVEQQFSKPDFVPWRTCLPSFADFSFPSRAKVHNWSEEDAQLSGYEHIDELVKEIIDYTLRDFIVSWYSELTNDQDFVACLRMSAYEIISNISRRLRVVDWTPFITRDIVDDFASHLRIYRKAKEKLKSGTGNEDIESYFFDYEFEMERNCCRDLVSTSKQYEKAYLKDLTDLLLYLCLPDADFESTPLRLLVREVLVNKVLLPLANQLASADYINHTIVWLLADFPIDYEYFVTVLETSDHLEELASVRDAVDHEIAVLRSNDHAGDVEVKQQLSSLQFVKRLVDAKLTREDDIVLPQSTPKNLPDLSLEFILSNHVALCYFIDFLGNVGGSNLIFLYIDIESFKASSEQQLSSIHLMQITRTGNPKQVYQCMETVREAAMGLFDQYLSEKAVENQRVLMDAQLVEEVLQKLSGTSVTESLFDGVQAKVCDMLRDSERYYPAFKNSPVYLKLLGDLDMLKSRNPPVNGASNEDGDNCSIGSTGSGELLDAAGFVSTLLETPYTYAQIQKILLSTKGNKAFAVYQIQVKQENSAGDVLAFWTINRRYSDFYDLHNVLESRYPAVVDFFSLPGKKTFNNLDNEFLERRRKALDTYLMTLVAPNLLKQNKGLEEIVSAFLAKGEFNKAAALATGKKIDFLFNNPIISGVKTMGNAVISVPDKLVDGIFSVGDELGKVTRTVFGLPIPANDGRSPSGSPEGRVAAILETENISENIPLRIILLLLDEVFNLRQRNQWFRRRLVAFLQQVIRATLGGTFNRKILDFVQWLTNADQVAGYIRIFKNSFWPHGLLADSYPERSKAVQMRTRVVAKAKMIGAVPDELRIFIGNETTRNGALMVFEALQNESFNRRLVYVLLEHLIKTIFPNNQFEQVFSKLHSKSPRCQVAKSTQSTATI